ncbi:hypothetical protein V6N13_031243 [Hibiscus sabdariffa]
MVNKAVRGNVMHPPRQSRMSGSKLDSRPGKPLKGKMYDISHPCHGFCFGFLKCDDDKRVRLPQKTNCWNCYFAVLRVLANDVNEKSGLTGFLKLLSLPKGAQVAPMEKITMELISYCNIQVVLDVVKHGVP